MKLLKACSKADPLPVHILYLLMWYLTFLRINVYCSTAAVAILFTTLY